MDFLMAEQEPVGRKRPHSESQVGNRSSQIDWATGGYGSNDAPTSSAIAWRSGFRKVESSAASSDSAMPT